MSQGAVNTFITPMAQKRLLKDVKDIIKKPLTDHGIYYVHDEQNILCGYACIIGPKDSLYANGAYLFRFEFPKDYPYQPPKLTYQTNDGTTRFHPNLYRNGKVCLSILNTWKGEQWTSCQTIRSILLTLVTLFHNKPLLNEPGFTEKHKDFIPYNKLIKYANYKSAIFGIVSERLLPNNFIGFYTFIKKHFIEHYDDILKRIEEEAKANNGRQIEPVIVRVYNLQVVPNFTILGEDFKKL